MTSTVWLLSLLRLTLFYFWASTFSEWFSCSSLSWFVCNILNLNGVLFLDKYFLRTVICVLFLDFRHSCSSLRRFDCFHQQLWHKSSWLLSEFQNFALQFHCPCLRQNRELLSGFDSDSGFQIRRELPETRFGGGQLEKEKFQFLEMNLKINFAIFLQNSMGKILEMSF